MQFIDNEMPLQNKPPHQICFNLEETKAVDKEISRLLQKGVITPSYNEPGQFVNTIFTRPKKDGNHRMILNLKPLNQFVEYKKFKMDTIKTVLQLMHKNCFMASIDISDAYYSVPISSEYHKFLKFIWKGQLYHYTALPNGYSDAPRVFTKLLKPVFAQIRRLGHNVVGYIDDLYIQAPSEQACRDAVETAAHILRQCGFLIHPEKSCFIPSNKIVYLGFELDSNAMTISLTEEKRQKYQQSCRALHDSPTATVRRLAKVTGQLVSTFPGVNYGPLFYRQMESTKIRALKANDDDFDTVVSVTPAIKEELSWWMTQLPTAKNAIYKGKTEIEILTDATLENWGAECGNSSTGGPFSPAELKWTNRNINACELLAILLGLQAYVQDVQGKIVLVRSDNTVAIAYLKHMGGTKSPLCNAIARKLWLWCIDHNIWLTAEHIPGIENINADFESRHVDNRLEWAIYPDIFASLCQRFGTPDIDMFATRLNTKLDKFVSWRPNPGAMNVDAFSISWNNLYVYLFPPFSLITKCLHKVRFDSTTALLIFPLWPTQPWFAQMSQMLISEPVLLPRNRQIYLPSQPRKRHPLRHLRLCACRLSGVPQMQQAFRTKLSTSSAIPGEKAHKNSMALSYKNGHTIVSNGISITIRPL